MNARVGVHTGHWQASLFTNNVLNKHAVLGVTGNEALNIPAFIGEAVNQPRTVGVDVSYQLH
jgi:hypothetical protein